MLIKKSYLKGSYYPFKFYLGNFILFFFKCFFMLQILRQLLLSDRLQMMSHLMLKIMQL